MQTLRVCVTARDGAGAEKEQVLFVREAENGD